MGAKMYSLANSKNCAQTKKSDAFSICLSLIFCLSTEATNERTKVETKNQKHYKDIHNINKKA